MSTSPSDGRVSSGGPQTPADDPSIGAFSGRDWGGLIFAVLLLLTGGYFLLRNTLGIAMPDIDWDALWPVLVILLGMGVLARGWTGHSHRHRRRDRIDHVADAQVNTPGREGERPEVVRSPVC